MKVLNDDIFTLKIYIYRKPTINIKSIIIDVIQYYIDIFNSLKDKEFM